MWSVAKALRFPLDKKLNDTNYLPYTISYVIRKRIQIDGINELPKDKRPPEKILWEGTDKDLDEWFNKVLNTTDSKTNYTDGIVIDLQEVE